MATLAANNLTLLDIAKRLDPDGSVSAIAELLSQDNELLQDIPMVEGNLPTGHLSTQRTGLPTLTWRKMNQGVATSKSRTAQVTDTCGMLEGLSATDIDLAMLNGNTASYRLSESASFIEAMNIDMASSVFYGDTTVNPERFMGLAPRFDDVPTTSGGAENKVNAIDGGGTGTDNSSIWLIGWSPDKVHGIYPKGSVAGLVHQDLGEDWAFDSSNNRYRALLDRYQWKIGLAVRDWRYVVRICNVDISDLTKNAATGADVTNLMTRALHRIHSLSGVQPRFYMNRTLKSFLAQQMEARISSSQLRFADIGNGPTMTFAGVPIRQTDALIEAEARIT